MKHTKHAQGFTLIELMIVVAIISILSAIAYPSYRQYVIKGRRAEGRAALMALLQAQERYYTQYGTYYVGKGTNPFKAYSGDSLDSSAYTLASAPCAGDLAASECVQITATQKTPSDDPKVGSLIISSVGPTRTCTGTYKDTDPSLCWK